MFRFRTVGCGLEDQVASVSVDNDDAPEAPVLADCIRCHALPIPESLQTGRWSLETRSGLASCQMPQLAAKRRSVFLPHPVQRHRLRPSPPKAADGDRVARLGLPADSSVHSAAFQVWRSIGNDQHFAASYRGSAVKLRPPVSRLSETKMSSFSDNVLSEVFQIDTDHVGVSVAQRAVVDHKDLPAGNPKGHGVPQLNPESCPGCCLGRLSQRSSLAFHMHIGQEIGWACQLPYETPRPTLVLGV